MLTFLCSLAAFILGGWLGTKLGCAAIDDFWINHLCEHGWVVVDENDEPCEPVQMYSDHWYDQRPEA